MRQGANRLALPCSPTSARPAKLSVLQSGFANAGQSERKLLCAGERRCCSDRLPLRDQIITEASLTRGGYVDEDRPGQFALLVEILWRPERIRLLVD